ncbi:DUF1059 domain-containing protein [Prauserella coralliicola]|nr:DUF1059 domain-containing protein [Prauserella coralliicola]
MEKPDDAAQRYLRCPCGELIEAAGDAALIERARKHLAAAHPGREYSDDEILFLAF